MRKTILLLVCTISLITNLKAQCTAGLTANTTSLITVSGTAWQTVGVVTGAKSYIEFAATTGNTYVFTLNSSVGGSCSFDEQLTITTSGGVADVGVFGTSTTNTTTTVGAEFLYWSPNSNGNYRIVVSRTGCVNTTAASTLACTSVAANTNFAIWMGTTSTTWTTTTNWGRRAAAGYPTNTAPAITDNVFINAGNTNQPNTGDNAANCLDLTAQANTTLTLNHTTNSLQVYGNFTMNGVLNHIGYIYIYFNGVGKTISGTGNFYGGTICPIRFVQGASYTLGAVTGNFLRVSHCYMDYTSGAGGTFSIGSNTLATHFFFQAGTFNQNTGTLMISGPNDVTKTYAPFFGAWASVDGTNPYFVGARFSAGTGTTYYNSGDFTNADNYKLNDQLVRSGTGSSVTYYNLKIRTNNGQTVTIGDAATTFTVSNQLEIYNPGTAGGVATTATDFTLNGTFLLGNSGNALTLNLPNRIARSAGGTGVFTMGNVSAHAVNVTYAHATNWAISLGAAGITTPLTFYGTATYNSSSAQKVMSNTYNNLTISGTGTRSLTANTTVNGNLLINAGTLDAVSGSNFNLNLRGNFTNYSTYTTQNNTTTFDGSGAQSINNYSATPSSYSGSTTGAVAIADNSPAAAANAIPSAATLSTKASLSIVVPGGTYSSISSVALSVTHTWNADVDLYLLTPNNTVLLLSTDNGSSGDNYANTVFSDAAGSSITTAPGTGIGVGPYQPEVQTLASYAGTFPGTWKLYACDGAAGDLGTLTGFTITLAVPSTTSTTVLNLYNMVIANGSGTSLGVTTNNNISINSAANTTLTNGVLKLNSYSLILNNTAATAISAGSNSTYIESETNAAINPSIVQWYMGATTGAHVYPFGVAGTYIPFTFNKTTAGVADISVSTRATASSNNTPWAGVSSVATVTNMNSAALGGVDGSTQSVIDRWWDIRTSAAVTGNLSFVYRGSENTTSAAPSGGFAAQHWNGSAWDAQVGTGTGVTSGTGTVTVTGANTFSPWILSSTTAPLPVELISFNAECDNNKTKLNWATASEKNNNYFTVEKSSDGINYLAIAQLEGHGNSSQVMNYSYTDNSENSEINYYRLKQTDFDGNFNYSPIVSSDNLCNGNNDKVSSFSVYPNPNSGSSLYLNYTVEKDETATIRLTTLLGQTYINTSLDLRKGTNTENININDVAPGVYFLEIESSQLKTSTTKFIKE